MPIASVQQQQQQQQQQPIHLPTQQQQQQLAATPVGGAQSPSQTPAGAQSQAQQHLTSPHHQQQQQQQTNSVPPGASTNLQQQQQQQQNSAVASGQTQIVAPSTASVSPSSVSSQPPDMSLLAPLHIPAIRPGFEADATAAVKRHPHPWAYDSDGFGPAQYHAQQYFLERERKPVFYGYPETQYQYWNYREQSTPAAAAYMSASDERHAAAAAARQSVEGTSQSSYETPTYSSPSGLRGYPSEAYPSSGGTAGIPVGTVGPCTPTNALHEWTGQVSVRKKRKPYSKFQTLELEKEFLYNAYVSKQKRWELARNLNLTERQVKIWFQNRRMKNKKNSQRQASQQNNNNSANSNHNHAQATQQHHNTHHMNLGLSMGHHTAKMHQ